YANVRCVDRPKKATYTFGNETVILIQKDGKQCIAINGQYRLIFLEGKRSFYVYGSLEQALRRRDNQGESKVIHTIQ
uniref:Uncharacterized protein n=1 Tax=Glossina palpalis gambiensis TaxID=67801 RepID=A0A1B0AX19_9MUSC